MSEHIFIRACFREDVERTPVWLMRQAGRYMAEYQAVKSRYSFLEMCKIPEVAAQVTLQPVNVLGVDAAILFSDILIPVEAMGMKLEFISGEGPRLYEPIRSLEQVERLKIPDPKRDLGFVLEAIKLIKEKLAGRVPLIGFSGAPFTLASYMIEGRSSRSFRFTKELMFSKPEVFELLMKKLTHTVVSYLNAQIEAGVDAVQLFDSWAGCLAPEDYCRYVKPYTSAILNSLDRIGEVPRIHFANQAGTFIEEVAKAGGDVIGIDWRIDLAQAWQRIGYNRAIQGNLDPMALFAPEAEIERRVRDILERAAGRNGHIFNLGHGVHKDTKVEKVKFMVEAVKKYGRR